MKLLVSSLDLQEALDAIAGGADIIDAKNPKEGALGASFPWVIRCIREAIPNTSELSCTLGDLPNLPGSVSLAGLGAASTGVDYVKASLFALSTADKAGYLMGNVVKAIKDFNSKVKVVATGFADAKRVSSVNPRLVPKIAFEAGCDLAMLDTAVKDGKTLLDFLSIEHVKSFVDEVHSYGMKAALAGSLRIQDLPLLCGVGADVIGVRGAACKDGDRVFGRILRGRVEAIAQVIRNTQNLRRAESL